MSVGTYRNYRDSGEGWLREIPDHWDTFAARRVFVQTRETANDSDEQLSATQTYGVIPQRVFMEREERKVVLALTGTGNFKHVKAGDFVISLRSFEGGIEYTTYDGCVSPAYTTLRAIMEISDRYWLFLLKSPVYIGAIQSVTQGIREGKNIDYTQFGALLMPFPPYDEQQSIAAFLDRETAKIDALVTEQERLLVLLAEKRQAVISRAVTQGLDPSVPMKDSGVEWLGRVPAHWNIIPLRHVIQCLDGQRIPLNKEERSVMQGNIPYWGANGIVDWVNESLFNEILILLGEDGAPFFDKEKSVAFLTSGPVWPNNHIHVLRCRKGDKVAFVVYALNQVDFANFINGSTRDKLTQDSMKSIPVAVPPLPEQQSIAAFLDHETAKIDALVSECLASINLLRERRSTLISAAVTGKIDVRGLVPVTELTKEAS